MSDDLISRQGAIKALCENGMCGDKNCDIFPCEDVKAIMRVPTIDPVKHGKWIWDDEGFHCSNCFYHAYGNTGEVLMGDWNYCPNCGAKMEGGKNEQQK